MRAHGHRGLLSDKLKLLPKLHFTTIYTCIYKTNDQNISNFLRLDAECIVKTKQAVSRMLIVCVVHDAALRRFSLTPSSAINGSPLWVGDYPLAWVMVLTHST